MATIKIQQVRSRIRCPKDQKRTLDALGLKKMNATTEKIPNVNDERAKVSKCP